MKVLITGSNGLLGQKLVRQCLDNSINFLATSKGENRNSQCPNEKYVSMDITSSNEVENVINSYAPTHVIHTAALTNVDQCETDPELCQLINVDAVKILFDQCVQRGIHFQLLSTDFVFDGENGPYKETDSVNPLSVYAKSKVDAENLLLGSTNKNWSIVRTIIVYGKGENLSRSNLILWALDALPKGEPMNIVNDQFRAPTWADDLAWACLRVCELNEKGIFHICGPETMSIAKIVRRVATHLKISAPKINEISSETLSQPAKRPPHTGFDLTKSRSVLGYRPKTLEETLELL
ncbi:MAG: SDR family oxidoreductase [Bacteroidetes bacterium]|nr:MAG: SDR family oxidoreductase [Bacteroidota bacterium]